jgi:hypothetical protein
MAQPSNACSALIRSEIGKYARLIQTAGIARDP